VLLIIWVDSVACFGSNRYPSFLFFTQTFGHIRLFCKDAELSPVDSSLFTRRSFSFHLPQKLSCWYLGMCVLFMVTAVFTTRIPVNPFVRLSSTTKMSFEVPPPYSFFVVCHVPSPPPPFIRTIFPPPFGLLSFLRLHNDVVFHVSPLRRKNKDLPIQFFFLPFNDRDVCHALRRTSPHWGAPSLVLRGEFDQFQCL